VTCRPAALAPRIPPLLAAGLACVALAACTGGPPVHTFTAYTRNFEVDRIYRSMRGPMDMQTFELLEGEPELLWITGYRARMVSPDTRSARSDEFMCHSNLDYDLDRHKRYFKWNKATSERLFTLSQGQLEVELPVGFGIPILSDERLTVSNQLLNLNPQEGRPVVRHEVELDFVRDRELAQPLKPLFMKAAMGMRLLRGDHGYYNTDDPDPITEGSACLAGEAAGDRVITDSFGREFVGHWVVPPGRDESRTLVTRWLNLPFDTTIHYVAIHVHPFAQSLELRDLTTGETVFKSEIRARPDRIGIAHLNSYASDEGLPVFRDHEYELVCVYDNPTDREFDSMAVMLLYMLDHEFEKPRLRG
jgi:hypothetical protein